MNFINKATTQLLSFLEKAQSLILTDWTSQHCQSCYGSFPNLTFATTSWFTRKTPPPSADPGKPQVFSMVWHYHLPGKLQVPCSESLQEPSYETATPASILKSQTILVLGGNKCLAALPLVSTTAHFPTGRHKHRLLQKPPSLAKSMKPTGFCGYPRQTYFLQILALCQSLIKPPEGQMVNPLNTHLQLLWNTLISFYLSLNNGKYQTVLTYSRWVWVCLQTLTG